MTSLDSGRIPRFSAKEAQELARELFGVTAAARSLPSYQDQNFRLRCEPTGRELVLKIANSIESEEALDLQNRAMEHVDSRCSLELSRLQPATSGQRIASVTGPEGSTHLVRLLTFVPGKALSNVETPAPDLLRDLGRAVADVDRALASFSHPAAVYLTPWDPRNAGLLRNDVRHIESAAHRRLAERFHERFASRVVPRLAGLRSSVIHNDASHHNVLVEETGQGGHRICGLLDFGEVVRSHTVCDPAVTAAYLVLDKDDPIATAVHILSGYHERLPLTEEELAVVHDLICARLIVSATSSAYRGKLDPTNEYLMANDRPAWAALEKLFAVGAREARRVFHRAFFPNTIPTPNASE